MRSREKEYPDFRSCLEQEVFSWPRVTTRFMFGCLAYMAQGKLFAFIQNESLVLTNLEGESRDALTADHEAFAFKSSDSKTIGEWIEVVISDESELEDLIPFIRKSYDAALDKALARPKKRKNK